MEVTPIGVYNINQNRPDLWPNGRDWPFFARRDMPMPDPSIEDATIKDMTADGYFQVLIHRTNPESARLLGEWEWVTIHESYLVKVEAPDHLFLP